MTRTWVSWFKFRRVLSVDFTFWLNKPERRFKLFSPLCVVPATPATISTTTGKRRIKKYGHPVRGCYYR